MRRGLQRSPAWESTAFVALPLDFATCLGLWISWMCIRKHQGKHLHPMPVISDDLCAAAIVTKLWSQRASLSKKENPRTSKFWIWNHNRSVSLSESDILLICVLWWLHILSVDSQQLCSVAHQVPSLGWNPARCHPCLSRASEQRLGSDPDFNGLSYGKALD